MYDPVDGNFNRGFYGLSQGQDFMEIFRTGRGHPDLYSGADYINIENMIGTKSNIKPTDWY